MPQRQIHREVFFAHNGIGPYQCYSCGGPIVFYDEFPIHHVDVDSKNNAPSNLRAMHIGCHIRLHKTGFVMSDETKAKMSRAGKGRVISPEHRAAIASSGRSRIWTDEARAKMSAAQKGRVVTLEHRQKIAATLKSQITPESLKRLSEMGRRGADARWKKGR